PPVLVADRDAAVVSPVAHETAVPPVVNFVADAAAGTGPDLSGLSAREAVRKLGTVGLIARLSGKGVVGAQEPPAGAPIERDAVCRLTLERWPSRRPATASHP